MFRTRREYSLLFAWPGVGGGDITVGTLSGAELTPTNRGRLATSCGDLVVEMESPMLLADRLLPVEASSTRSTLLARELVPVDDEPGVGRDAENEVHGRTPKFRAASRYGRRWGGISSHPRLSLGYDEVKRFCRWDKRVCC